VRSLAWKAIAATLTAALLLGWFPSAATAESVTGIITGAGVNIRSTPGGPVIGSAAKGEIVTVEGTDGNYYRIVTSESLKGYVYKQYVDMTLSRTGGDEGDDTSFGRAAAVRA
jgi:uncharacterized protein YgiM (DUF1202 family)